MTKLEKKLIELGYELSVFQEMYIKYYKGIDNCIYIQLSSDKDEIKWNWLYCQSMIDKQEYIDTLQQAFDIMQNDLEILKGIKND